MENKNFWNDAAIYGALIGVADIAFETLGLTWTSPVWNVLALLVFVGLLYIFTKRRATRCGGGEAGFSYGQGLKYIFWMMIFAGVLVGAWQIVARNVFFTAKYEEALAVSQALVENVYSAEMAEMSKEMSHKMMFSPLWIMFSALFWYIVKGVFFGLFISAFTKRDPQLFKEE